MTLTPEELVMLVDALLEFETPRIQEGMKRRLLGKLDDELRGEDDLERGRR